MGFADPIALGFATLIGVLVLLYLWERRRQRVMVPSLLLWETLRVDPLRARRFRPDLLFFLQLLVLACLIGGLARPFFTLASGTAVGARHILVLDTTASMQAREDHTTRFEQARAQAERVLAEFAPNDEVMVLSAADHPEVLIGFTRDHAAVHHALAAAEPIDTGGDLSVALAMAENARAATDADASIDVFTDIGRQQLPAPERDRVRVFQSGETDDNLAITALQIFQGRFQPVQQARAYVLVRNESHRRERHGVLTLALNEHILNRAGFTIPAQDSKAFLFHGFDGPGHVTARLEGGDALPVDDVAHAWVHDLTPVRVLLVSRASALVDDLKDLSSATPGLAVRVAAPAEYSTSDAAQADVVVFNAYAPDTAPPANALYVYPPPENELFPVAAEAENVEVLDWAERHPAVEGLRPLSALPLQHARIITAPSWSEPLLWSRTRDREFPLVLAGEWQAHRVACLAFDLQRERLLGSDNVNWFLLFMNLLSWLAPADAAARVVHTGDLVPVGHQHGAPAGVRDPHGGTLILDAGAPGFVPRWAGEYQVVIDGSTQTVLANFFDATESDIGRGTAAPPVMPPRRPAHPAAAPPRREVGAWLYAVAAVVLLAEWFVARWSVR